MLSIDALSLRVPVRHPTLIDLDLPQIALVNITGNRKQILTYAQETTRAKLERLCSARHIPGDQQITTRHAKALLKTTELVSLLITRFSTIMHVN
jgi:hypothetical protein